MEDVFGLRLRERKIPHFQCWPFVLKTMCTVFQMLAFRGTVPHRELCMTVRCRCLLMEYVRDCIYLLYFDVCF